MSAHTPGSLYYFVLLEKALTQRPAPLYSIQKREMDTTLAQRAINLALEGKWEEGVKANLEILSFTPEDIDALNRLARCYSELGKLPEAKKTAQKVLEIDPLNTIAQKCLDRWTVIKKSGRHNQNTSSPESFLEESGKTKIAPLMHTGDANILATVDSGDEVQFLPHTHRVSVITGSGKFLGRLHDDLAAKIRNLLKEGFKYQVFIKSVDPKKGVTVFIREIAKGPKARDLTSFPPEKIDYVSFTSPELVHKDMPEIEMPEES